MAREVHTKETDERQTVVGQERPPVEEPPAPVPGAIESRQEATPAGIPSAAPPTPPRRPLTAQRQQIPPGGRWALGIGLVVLGGLAWFVFGFLAAATAAAAAVPAVMCLVAGWLLRSWWGLLAAAVVYVAVAALSWVLFVSGFPLPIEFALYVVLPAVVMSAIGTAIGMYRAQRRQMPPGGRWALGIGLVVLGGLTWLAVLGGQNAFAESLAAVAAATYGWGIVGTTLLVALPAVMCLVAGWLLRSWWGLLAAAVVYVAVTALMWVLFVRAGSLPVELALYAFALYVVLPAVVMSAIGTAIGMYRAR